MGTDKTTVTTKACPLQPKDQKRDRKLFNNCCLPAKHHRKNYDPTLPAKADWEAGASTLARLQGGTPAPSFTGWCQQKAEQQGAKTLISAGQYQNLPSPPLCKWKPHEESSCTPPNHQGGVSRDHIGSSNTAPPSQEDLGGGQHSPCPVVEGSPSLRCQWRGSGEPDSLSWGNNVTVLAFAGVVSEESS